MGQGCVGEAMGKVVGVAVGGAGGAPVGEVVGVAVGGAGGAPVGEVVGVAVGGAGGAPVGEVVGVAHNVHDEDSNELYDSSSDGGKDASTRSNGCTAG